MLEQAPRTTAGTPGDSRTLHGTPVVPGLAYGRVVRPAPAPALPAATTVAEADRDAEAERFTAAANTVADRLAARSAASSGVSAEVLQATAVLARDRGLLVGLLVGAVTLGSASPHLIALLGGADWRATVATASALAALGAFLALGARLGPHVLDLRSRGEQGGLDGADARRLGVDLHAQTFDLVAQRGHQRTVRRVQHCRGGCGCGKFRKRGGLG